MSKKKLKKKLRKAHTRHVLERSDLLIRAEAAEYDLRFSKSGDAAIQVPVAGNYSIIRSMNKEQIKEAVEAFSMTDEICGDEPPKWYTWPWYNKS